MNEIICRELALDQLADLYVAATLAERETLAREVEEVSRRLATNAQFEGESRGGFARVVVSELVVVIYTVVPHEPVRVVELRPNKPLRK
jgi:plasmid stabilization system protein ParE